jgi:hypothetical protein
MADLTKTTFDALHEDYAARHARTVEEDMVKALLAALDPQEQDYHLPYLGILRRLQAVLAQEIAKHEGVPDGTL